jgi:glycolate oxidase
MHLPEPIAARLAQRDQVLKELGRILPQDVIVSRDEDLTVYESDAVSAYRSKPMIVLLPRSTEEVSAAMKVLHRL